MTRASLLCVLLVGLCLAGQALGSDQRRRSQQSLEIERDFPGQQQPQAFRSGHEYTFTYNGQIATGLQQDTATAGDAAQQKSATRIQAQAKIQFHSDRHATLRLEQIRLGHLNQRIAEPQQVQPMGMFEQKQIEQSKRQELQLPLAFTYEDGVVARIQFHPDDSTWSKNIKRSVLNLIQLNLKRNNAQGLRTEEVGQQLQSAEQKGQQGPQQLSFTKVFTIPEITIEGECATTYTINKAQRQQRSSAEIADYDEEQQRGWSPQSASCPNCFNVTKSINFKQCNKIADVAYGYQTQQQQPQCAECQQQWAQQQQNLQQGPKQQERPSPCDLCDPKEVKENKLERTTVHRFVLSGKPEKYAIKRVELISQYVYKNLRAESGRDGATMQAVVAAELILRGVRQQSPQGGNQQVQQLQKIPASTDRDESLLFSNNWDTEEKRFYMYGDEEFQRNNPFAKVTNKVEQAQGIIRKLIQVASNKANGIESEEVVQIQRLVELLRMCSEQELKNIQQSLGSDSQQQQSGPEQQKISQIFGDALAMAGTRNTINMLVNQILNHQLSPAKAAQTLKALSGLPAPSDSQVAIVLRLCKNELVQRNPALKQSCWLTFGGMVGELCKHKTQKNAQQSVFGAQSGFNKEEICPTHKKEIYKQTLVEKYQEARTTYEKVLALKALGNAGIDIAVPKLEEIIKDKREQRIPRIQAIDALRRLRTQMPRKIQRVLLPIFLNTREHPAVRMAAFSMIMNTQPEQPIVDQIAYTLTKERSQQVQSFVYTTMQALAKSKVPCQQNFAKHLKSALKLANIDEGTLSGSRKYQVPIYSAEEKEGLFLTLTSVVSSRSALPSHLSVSMASLLNGEFEMNNVKIDMTQTGIEQWYEKLVQQFLRQARQYVQQPTRGQRSGEQNGQGSAELRRIFSTLGIKSRKAQGFTSMETTNEDERSNQREQPFGMINVRIGDVDQAVLALDKQSLPEIVRQVLNGDKPSLRHVIEALEQPQHFRLLTAQNLNEKTAKIATSLGVPLRMLSATPILAAIDGQIKMAESTDRLDSNGSPKVQLQMHATVAVAHIQRMETWLPAIVTGVESVRSAEINVPLQAEAMISRQKGLEITVKLPQGQKTRVFGVHTLPVTYFRDFDPKTKMMKAPRVKLIRNEELEQLQRDVQKVVGQHTLGMPFHIKGHFHCPASVSSYKQLVQLLMASENQVHVSYEPTSESPRAIRLTATGSAFQKVDTASGTSHRPELKEFYSNSVKFQHAYPEDYEDMQLEDHNQRREKLSSFLNAYQPEQSYKHQLKLSVETSGGQRKAKAQMEVTGACDAKFSYCKAFVDVERSPIYADETQPWQLKSKIQILSPERVSSVRQLDQADKKHQKFVAQADTQWGASEKKQFINLRIQGEQAKKPQWRDQIVQRHQQQRGNSAEQDQESMQQAIRTFNKKTAFLNKFDLVADYKLQAPMQNAFSRAFETVKAYNYWNTESQLANFNQQVERSQAEGHVYATLVIDPISQRYANVSVKTPSQSVRMQAIRLSTPVRPFPLVRQQAEKSTHSVQQLFERVGANSRAECKADGKRVSTFDNAVYKAPVSKCYSVLAKDCSSNEPQYAVLMKSLGQQGQQSGQQQPKKIKVITRNQIIECEPKSINAQQPIEDQPLKCKVNGQEISQRQQSSFEDETRVQFDDQEKTAVTIDVESTLQVRFNGAKVWIKLSSAHKESQCGLCGHYDDQAEDEWRMAGNERANGNDLAQFHRSFSIQDNQECSQDEHNQFYQQNSGKFTVESEEFGGLGEQDKDGQRQRDQGYMSGSPYSEEEYSDNEEQSWWGVQKQRKQWKGQQNNRGRSSSSQSSQEVEQPIKKTKVVELHNNKICFSTQPVKQCPEGTHPAHQEQQEPISDYSSTEQQGPAGTKKVAFSCMDRSLPESRNLMRQARNGRVIDASELPKPNFSEFVKQPTAGCVRY